MREKQSLAGSASSAAISTLIEEPRPVAQKPDLVTQLTAGSKSLTGPPATQARRKPQKKRPELSPVKPEPPPHPDSPDLLIGMSSIAKFWKIQERLAYRLAAKGRLPGVFKLSEAIWAMDPVVAKEVLRERARGVCA
jgi:hypothetical protein